MITIIDYSAGNLRSVQRACTEVGAQSVITNNPADVAKAEKIIFPGIGAAPSAMEYMTELGLDIALKEAFEKGTPILGICLGAQIVLEKSEEGDGDCLGLVAGKTVRFKLQDKVRSLAAEGKLSAIILIALPIFVVIFLRFSNPDYINMLVVDPIGRMVAGVCVLLMCIGVIVIKKMIHIKV